MIGASGLTNTETEECRLLVNAGADGTELTIDGYAPVPGGVPGGSERVRSHPGLSKYYSKHTSRYGQLHLSGRPSE